MTHLRIFPVAWQRWTDWDYGILVFGIIGTWLARLMCQAPVWFPPMAKWFLFISTFISLWSFFERKILFKNFWKIRFFEETIACLISYNKNSFFYLLTLYWNSSLLLSVSDLRKKMSRYSPTQFRAAPLKICLQKTLRKLEKLHNVGVKFLKTG